MDQIIDSERSSGRGDGALIRSATGVLVQVIARIGQATPSGEPLCMRLCDVCMWGLC